MFQERLNFLLQRFLPVKISNIIDDIQVYNSVKIQFDNQLLESKILYLFHYFFGNIVNSVFV